MVRLKVTAYIALANEHGHCTYEQKAEAAGLGIATIHRISQGAPVGGLVISRLVSMYGVGFDQLFEVVTTPEANELQVPA